MCVIFFKTRSGLVNASKKHFFVVSGVFPTLLAPRFYFYFCFNGPPAVCDRGPWEPTGGLGSDGGVLLESVEGFAAVIQR